MEEAATAKQALAPAKAACCPLSPRRRPRRPHRRAAHASQKAASTGSGPKLTSAFEQLRAAQGGGATADIVREQSDYYHATKTTIFNALINTIDLAQLAQLDLKTAGEEIRDIVAELVAIKNVSMSVAEQEHLVQDIINDVLGYGPLEPLLARDDIADIMVNGAGRVFIEVAGKVQLTNVRFRDNAQLMNICQRIVSQVGRRVDESSPICDARLADGSRVNVIAPPLALDGPTLTIRKFKKDKLTMRNLVEWASISPERRAGARRHRRLAMQRPDLRRHGLRQDDAPEHPHGVHRSDRAGDHLARTRPNCSCSSPTSCVWKRARPTWRGRARSPCATSSRTAFGCARSGSSSAKCAGRRRSTSLQAMNTGHDGSILSTLHANSPREAISRIESRMITMGGYGLPSKTIREMIVGSVDVIIQAARLRDGSRRITHVTEVVGLEGEVIITQDLFVYEITGEDEHGGVVGRHRSTGIARPRFWDRARYYGLERELAEALDAAE